jgi:hypothetical protein
MMSAMLVLGFAGYAVDAWADFAVAEVGAAAALAGLLVIASSINIVRIIELPAVVQRLGATLTVYTGILAVGTLPVNLTAHRLPHASDQHRPLRTRAADGQDPRHDRQGRQGTATQPAQR